MRTSTLTGLLGLLLLLGTACTTARSQTTPPPDAPPTAGFFTDRILPLLQTRFAPLLQNEPGLSLASWESLMAGSEHGAVVIPFDPENSLLLQLATKLPADHPLRPHADALTADEIALVRQWIADGARNDDGEVPFADATNLAYVASQNGARVWVIDMDRQLQIRTIDLQALGFSANAKPHHVAVEPDGAHWYVSLIAENKVLKFDRENRLVGQVAFERPGLLALDPARDTLYVGRSMAAVNPPQRIGIITRSTLDIEEVGVFFPRPHALAVDSRRNVVYSASLAENSIATVDMTTGDVALHRLDGPVHTLVQFALSPDGNTLIATGQMTGKLLIFDASNPPELPLLASLDVGAEPWHPVFSPDGRFAYFANKRDNNVAVVDVPNREVVAHIEGPGLAEPHGAALSPDGRYLFVSSNNLKGGYTPRYPFVDTPAPGTVTVIDTATRAIVRVLEIGPYGSGMGTAAR